jgi:hypothetical protein
MTLAMPQPVDNTAATPAFRRVLAGAAALAVFWLLVRAFPAGVVADVAAAAAALAVGALAWRNATFLLATFVVLMPVGLFVLGVLGL